MLGRFNQIVKQVATSQRSANQRYRYLNEVHNQIASQADDLIKQCKNMVLQNMEPNRTNADRIHERELNASLRHIESLREQLELAAQLCEAPPETLRPSIKK